MPQTQIIKSFKASCNINVCVCVRIIMHKER